MWWVSQGLCAAGCTGNWSRRRLVCYVGVVPLGALPWECMANTCMLNHSAAVPILAGAADGCHNRAVHRRGDVGLPGIHHSHKGALSPLLWTNPCWYDWTWICTCNLACRAHTAVLCASEQASAPVPAGLHTECQAAFQQQRAARGEARRRAPPGAAHGQPARGFPAGARRVPELCYD